MADLLHQRFQVAPVRSEASHLQHDLSDGGLDLLDVGHAWQLPIRRYGSSFVAKCSCGWTSNFFLTVDDLLASACEKREGERASRARAAMVGW
jgi:hypothetical protein